MTTTFFTSTLKKLCLVSISSVVALQVSAAERFITFFFFFGTWKLASATIRVAEEEHSCVKIINKEVEVKKCLTIDEVKLLERN